VCAEVSSSLHHGLIAHNGGKATHRAVPVQYPYLAQEGR
jgi:hypothetical protein